MNTHQILFREVYNLVSLVARERPGTTNQLGSATFRKKVSSSRRLGKLQLCANPLSQSDLAPLPRKHCVLERSTPFQLKCHSQISCLRGKRRSTHALFFEHLLHIPGLGSAHSADPLSKPQRKRGPGPRPRPGTRLPDRVSPELPAWAAIAAGGDHSWVGWGRPRTAGGVSPKGRKTASP